MALAALSAQRWGRSTSGSLVTATKRSVAGESFQHVSRANGGIAGATNHRPCGGIYLGIVSTWDVWSRPVREPCVRPRFDLES